MDRWFDMRVNIITSSHLVTNNKKVNALKTLSNSDNDVARALRLSLDDFLVSRDSVSSDGIGSGGMGFNTTKRHRQLIEYA